MSARTKSLIQSITFPTLLLAVLFVLTTKVSTAAPYWIGWGYAIVADFNGTEADVQLVVIVKDSSGAAFTNLTPLHCAVRGDNTTINGGLHLDGNGTVTCQVPSLQETLIEFTSSLGDEWSDVTLDETFGDRPYYAEAELYAANTEETFGLIQGLEGNVDFQMFNSAAPQDRLTFSMDEIALNKSEAFNMAEFGKVAAAIYNTPCDEAPACTYQYLFNGLALSPVQQAEGGFTPFNWEESGYVNFADGLEGTLLSAVWDPFCSGNSPICN